MMSIDPRREYIRRRPLGHVKLDAVLVNGERAFEDQFALIDTGTAYILTSPTVFQKAQKADTRCQPNVLTDSVQNILPAR
jgi:predicted aspartyl protease